MENDMLQPRSALFVTRPVKGFEKQSRAFSIVSVGQTERAFGEGQEPLAEESGKFGSLFEQNAPKQRSAVVLNDYIQHRLEGIGLLARTPATELFLKMMKDLLNIE
jgi:hypothetical protein